MTKILLVGCGKMGGALLKGWSKNSAYTISTLDPHVDDADYKSAAEITSTYDVMVLAVKPQVMTETLASLKSIIAPTTLLLSIAAGKTIAFFENKVGENQPIIRAMPNTPALVNKGISVLCGNKACTAHHRQSALDLLASVSNTAWIDDEYLMDAVTALSGSGPAYVFHLIEAMGDAGKAAGLPAALAENLARQTVIGAAALAEDQSSFSAATLRQNVTSPGGTTEAALKILMADDGLTSLMTRAVLAAKTRGQELA